MGAIFPVLDKEIDGVDISAVSGKLINRFSPELDEMARNLGVRGLMSFFGAAPEEYFDEDELGELEIPEEYLSEKWFEPEDGLRTIETLLDYLTENSSVFGNETRHVAADLEEFEKVLQKAGESGAKWHVEVEI